MTEKLKHAHEGVVPLCRRPIHDSIRRLREMPVRRPESLDDQDTDDDLNHDERGRHCRPHQ